MSCYYNICDDNWEEEGDAFDFDSMWFDIPTPFHAGDIVCNLQRPEEPFVLLDLQTWNSQRVDKELPPSAHKERLIKKADKLLKRHRHDGDTSDMGACGYQLSADSSYPFYIGEPASFLLDIDYYRKPLKSKERILYGIRAYIKGDLGIDSLVTMSSAYELQALAERKAHEFEQVDSWLRDYYPELFDITVGPQSQKE